MMPDATKRKTPTALTAGVQGVQSQLTKERSERMNSTGQSKNPVAFEGEWETLTRKQFPDLSGTKEGHLVAVEAIGHGVIVGSTSDPVFYMLTLEKRYKMRGIKLGAVVVTTPVQDCYAHARTMAYDLTGQRSNYSGLVGLCLADVKSAIVARLGMAAS